MKIICNGADFSNALNKVNKALPTKKTQPILEGIKLSAYGDCLTLTATDYNFTIIKKIKAEVKMEGEVLVPGRLLTDLSAKIGKEENIELSDVSSDNLTIKYSDSHFFIKLLNISEYPLIKENDYDNQITLMQKDLKDMIRKTIFSAATDGARPVLKGCLVEIENNEMRMVALDGYRLAISKKVLPMEYPNMEIIVPAIKGLDEIEKLLEDTDDIVTLNVANNCIMVDLKHTQVITNLLSGTFIKYKNTLLNTNFETEITVDKNLLFNTIDRASVLSKQEKNNLIKMEVKDGTMIIYSASENGESNGKIAAYTKGKDVSIGFNAEYIKDCLKNIDDEYIILKISTPTSPATITPVDGDDYLFLILPIR